MKRGTERPAAGGATRILTVVGARPQFVKAAVVSREIAARPDLEEIILHTGQHFDRNMSDVFFEEMGIPEPRYNLGIGALRHGEMTGRMLEGIERVLLEEKPDAVMVYGDTNSTLAGALAARKLDRRVVHVEAGMRSGNLRMPEEVNRVLTDRISDLLCCSTARAVENLRAEGYGAFPCAVVRTGDVMMDAALRFRDLAAGRSTILRELGLEGKRFVLCTVHRAENTDEPARLRGILAALDRIAREAAVVLPLHPRTAAVLRESGLRPAFAPVDPVGYLDMLRLLQGAEAVLTDSGGLQKEAFFLGRPCVTLRDETEWTELVDGGYNRLAGADTERILEAYAGARASAPDFSADLYGRGDAGRNIVRAIADMLGR